MISSNSKRRLSPASTLLAALAITIQPSTSKSEDGAAALQHNIYLVCLSGTGFRRQLGCLRTLNPPPEQGRHGLRSQEPSAKAPCQNDLIERGSKSVEPLGEPNFSTWGTVCYSTTLEREVDSGWVYSAGQNEMERESVRGYVKESDWEHLRTKARIAFWRKWESFCNQFEAPSSLYVSTAAELEASISTCRYEGPIVYKQIWRHL